MAFKPTRRFFIWSGLAAGALVVGYALTPFSTLDRARRIAGKGEAMLTAWVRIAPDPEESLEVWIRNSKSLDGPKATLARAKKLLAQAPLDPARVVGQRVLYVTERGVFRPRPEGGLGLIEIAPGIDLQRHILAQMDFTPAISPDLKTMDARLFDDEPLGLRERLLAVPLAERIEYQPRGRVLFINFEGLAVDSAQDIAEIETEVSRRVAPIGARVDVVVNYDHFSIRPELMDAYGAMVKRLEARWYDRVTRYAASGFLKARLGR